MGQWQDSKRVGKRISQLSQMLFSRQLFLLTVVFPAQELLHPLPAECGAACVSPKLTCWMPASTPKSSWKTSRRRRLLWEKQPKRMLNTCSTWWWFPKSCSMGATFCYLQVLPCHGASIPFCCALRPSWSPMPGAWSGPSLDTTCPMEVSTACRRIILTPFPSTTSVGSLPLASEGSWTGGYDFASGHGEFSWIVGKSTHWIHVGTVLGMYVYLYM